MRPIFTAAPTFRGLLPLGASLLALVAITNALAAHSSILAGGTFGRTQVGTSIDNGGANYLDVSGPYSVSSAASVTKLSAYVAGGTSASRIRGVVYADSGGKPAAFVAATPEFSIAAGQAAGWVDLTFTTPVSIAAGSFWLGYWYADSNSRHYYASQAGAERFVLATYSGTGSPPASFGTASSSSSSYSLYSTYTTSADGAPVNTALPSISGTAQQGQTLATSNGTWTNSPTTFGYQWQDCDNAGANCAPIGGATLQSYVPAASDVGHTIRVVVAATNAAGSAAATSTATAPVSAGGGPYSFVRRSIPLGAYSQVTEGDNIGDINADSKPDVVVAGDGYLVWYRNPDWAPTLIASGHLFGAGAMVVVADVNGDGRLDVITGEQDVAACTGVCQTDWFEQTPTGWVRHVLTTGAKCHDLAWADLNGDGRPDLACADQHLGQVVWMEQPADPTQPWTVHLIDARPAMGVVIADIDGDGSPDVVSGQYWYDNTANGSSWTRHRYSTLQGPTYSGIGDFSNFEKLNVVDINGDGRPDIVSTQFADNPGAQEWAFLAPSDPTTQAWTAVQIDPGPLFAVHSQVIGDFDGSGKLQIAVGESDPGGWDFGANPHAQLNIYKLVGNPADSSGWQKTTIDVIAAHEMRTADLNGDGHPDLIADFENTDLLNPPQPGAVHWWQNNLGGPAQIPSNSTPPTVFGTARQGVTLSASSDFWTGTTPITLTYQWQDCDGSGSSCSPISGASSSTYLLAGGDVGHTVRLVVTATNSSGSSSITSLATAVVVAAAAPAVSVAPSISGAAQQGQTLTASKGTWTNSPTSYVYQWRDCDSLGGSCLDIGGATGPTYLLQASDVGDTVRVIVTATNTAGSASAPSPSTALVTAATAGASTFGQTQAGSSFDTGGAGYLDLSGPYTVSASVAVGRLSAYVAGGASVSKLRGVIYADNGGQPGALVGVTPEVTIAARQAAGWVNLTFTTPVSIAAGSFWLGYWYADSNSRHYFVGQAGAERFVRAAYSSTSSPPAAFGAAATSSSSYSLYATYSTP